MGRRHYNTRFHHLLFHMADDLINNLFRLFLLKTKLQASNLSVEFSLLQLTNSSHLQQKLSGGSVQLKLVTNHCPYLIQETDDGTLSPTVLYV